MTSSKRDEGKPLERPGHPGPIEPGDTCARCGLRRATRELEQKGIPIRLRLCDKCYWGVEPAAEAR